MKLPLLLDMENNAIVADELELGFACISFSQKVTENPIQQKELQADLQYGSSIPEMLFLSFGCYCGRLWLGG